MRARLQTVRRGLVNAFLTIKPTNQSCTKNEFLSLYFSSFECTKWISKVENNLFLSRQRAESGLVTILNVPLCMQCSFHTILQKASLSVSSYSLCLQSRDVDSQSDVVLLKWTSLWPVFFFQSLFNEPPLHCLKSGSIKDQIILRIWSMCFVLTS